MEKEKTPDSQSDLEQKEKHQEIAAVDFEVYYKTTVIKVIWYW